MQHRDDVAAGRHRTAGDGALEFRGPSRPTGRDVAYAQNVKELPEFLKVTLASVALIARGARAGGGLVGTADALTVDT
jgi:hypothetical protein